jgi:DNA polymerase-1
MNVPFIMQLMLIDGNCMARRFFSGMEGVTNDAGTPVGMFIGWVNMFIALMNQYHPDAIVAVFEEGSCKQRQAIFHEYKAHRLGRPADFELQMPLLKDLSQSLGIHTITGKDIEADDIIANYAVDHLARDYKNNVSTIVSADKDFICLLACEKVRLLRPGNGTREWIGWTAQTVIDKYGFPPNRFPDFLALTGDKSDGFDGVTGIGPKKARDLINQNPSIEHMRFHAIDPLRKKINESISTIRRNQKLVRFMTGLNIDPLTLSAYPRDFPKAIKILVNLGLSSHAAKVIEFRDAEDDSRREEYGE